MKKLKLLCIILTTMIALPAAAQLGTQLKIETKKGLSVSTDNGNTWRQESGFDMAEYYGSPVIYKVLGVSPNFDQNNLFFICTLPAKPIGKEGKFVWRCNYLTKEVKKVIIDNDRNFVSEISFTPKVAKRELIFAATAHGAFISRDMGKSWSCLYRSKGIKRVIASPQFESDNTIELLNAKNERFISTDGGKSFNLK